MVFLPNQNPQGLNSKKLLKYGEIPNLICRQFEQFRLNHVEVTEY
jgi:hypothetical protein